MARRIPLAPLARLAFRARAPVVARTSGAAVRGAAGGAVRILSVVSGQGADVVARAFAERNAGRGAFAAGAAGAPPGVAPADHADGRDGTGGSVGRAGRLGSGGLAPLRLPLRCEAI